MGFPGQKCHTQVLEQDWALRGPSWEEEHTRKPPVDSSSLLLCLCPLSFNCISVINLSHENSYMLCSEFFSESPNDWVVLGAPDTASGFKFGSDQHVEKRSPRKTE